MLGMTKETGRNTKRDLIHIDIQHASTEKVDKTGERKTGRKRAIHMYENIDGLGSQDKTQR